MKDHMNPMMQEKQDCYFILGVKCLNSSKLISFLACTLKNNFVDVSISNIIISL